MTNKSIQPSHKHLVDQSIQGQNNLSVTDRSIQRTVFYQDDRSMQYAPSMVSKKPSVKDQSVSMEKVSMKSKNIMYKP